MGVKHISLIIALSTLAAASAPHLFAQAYIFPGGFCLPAPDPCSGPHKPPECFEPPEEEEPEPIVLVPGIIVSLNPEVIFFNEESNVDWDYAPGAENIYKGLTERLQQAGLEVTVAHYDWPKPATENRQYL